MSTPIQFNKPFAWGVIGTGPAARDFTEDLSFVTERACFVKAVLGAEGPELDEFVDKYHVPLSYTDMQSFLEESQVDAVFIAAPANFRYPYTIRCLQGGAPVLCESPLALTNAQAINSFEVASRTGVFLMGGMPLRFLPSLYVVQSLIHTGSIGEILSVKASLSGTESRGVSIPEGGALLTYGSYPLFFCLFFLGEPASVKATGRVNSAGVDENCTCLLSYEDGRYATMECSYIAGARDEAVITGSKGIITIKEPWNGKTSGITIEVNGEILVQRESNWEGKGLHFEATEVIRCLEEGRTQSELMTHAMSRRLAGVLEEIRGQLHLGQAPITV